MRCRFLLLFLCPSLADAAPLVLYDAPNLEGSGAPVAEAYTLYRGADIPASLDDAISSFRLAAGHMLVVAAPWSGLGPSKTFVAAEEDLVVNALPPELDNAISFLRVVPWRPTLKKGTGGDLGAQPSVDASWYYLWSYDRGRGQALDAREYVPMSWGAGGAGDDDIFEYRAMDQVSHLLGFNESDNCNDQSGQFNNLCDVPTAVGFFRNLQKAGLRLGSPAPREGGARNASSWLSQFIDQSEAADVRVDFVALHWYDWGSNPAANPNDAASAIFRRFQLYLSNAYHRYRRPLWITEFNANIHRATATQNDFLALALPYLETLGYVERYAWFQPTSGTGDFFADGELTSTGRIYRDQVSTPAYAAETLPAPWQSVEIGGDGGEESGTALFNRSVFTVSGDGTGVQGSSDALQFTHHPLVGGGVLVARLESLLPRVASTAGLMMRESLDAGSRFVGISLHQDEQVIFSARGTEGGDATPLASVALSVPLWFKLAREGDLFAGYTSADGQNWSLLGSTELALSTDIDVGMAVSSGSTTSFNDAIFQVPDSDLDQLTDAWERAAFGNLTSSSGGSDDFDRDGSSDVDEFRFGTEPADPVSFFRLLLQSSSEGPWVFAFEGAAGRTYTLETSERLTPESWILVDSVTPENDGPQILEYAPTALTDPVFGRIRVSNDE